MPAVIKRGAVLNHLWSNNIEFRLACDECGWKGKELHVNRFDPESKKVYHQSHKYNCPKCGKDQTVEMAWED